MNGQALIEFLIFLAVIIPLVILWIYTALDVIRRADLSALAKILWLVCIIAFPYFGAILYLVLRSTAAGWKEIEEEAGEATDAQPPNAQGNGRA